MLESETSGETRNSSVSPRKTKGALFKSNAHGHASKKNEGTGGLIFCFSSGGLFFSFSRSHSL
jgi:hypothetical protein